MKSFMVVALLTLGAGGACGEWVIPSQPAGSTVGVPVAADFDVMANVPVYLTNGAALGKTAVQPSDPTYTDTVAKAITALQSESDPLAVLADGSRALSGDLSFMNGTRLSAGSNAFVRVCGTNEYPVYDVGNPPVAGQAASLRADGITLRLRGNTLSVLDYIPNNVLSTWYRLSLHLATDGQDFLGGMSALFQTEGHGIDGALTTGATWAQPGYRNSATAKRGALQFGRVAGQRVVLSSITGIPSGASPISVSCWARWYNSHGINEYITAWSLGSSTPDGNNILEFTYFDALYCAGGLGYHMHGWGNTWATTVDPGWTENAWHHSVYTYDGTTQRMYLDGTNVAERVWTPATLVENGYVWLGESPVCGWAMEGAVAEFGIWDRCLTGDEVAQATTTNYALGGSITNGLVVRYHFNEGSGTNVADSSGQGNHATFNGTGVTWCAGPGFVATDMTLVTSNQLFEAPCSNALITAVVDGIADPSHLALGLRDVLANTTRWGTGLRMIDSTLASNVMWGADLTNALMNTNRQIVVTISSNANAVVKGVAAAMGE